MFVSASISAQTEIKVEEPEFINRYYVLTSDSTFEVLPKEVGSIQKHQSKSHSLLKKIGGFAKVATAAGFAGAMIGVDAGSISGVVN